MFHTSKKRAGKRLAHKGQFTLFVIVGLLIFFAFAFALYARVKVVTSMTSVQADVQIKNYINQNSIDQYVTSCLDAVSDDIFVNAAMQGGTLNFTDKVNNTDYIEYFDQNYNRAFNVSIVVKANDVCRPNPGLGDNYLVTQEAGPYPSRCNVPDRISNMPSAYVNLAPGPCRNSCFGKDFFLYSGFFGINDLPMLCDPNGANSYRLSQGAGAILSCDYYDNYGKSMQQILEEEITREINKCVNISAILEKVPSNITQIGEVNTSIIFKYGGFIIKLQYPITVTVRNSQPVTRLVDFEIKRDIQYKEVYEYAYELINNDIKKPEFEMFRDMRKVVGMSSRRRNQTIYSDNLRVNVIPGRSENNWINIVQVTDTNRTILGHNVTLTFAVANRRPVLDYIHTSGSIYYDIAVSEDQLITLTPSGYDPDDESVQYVYSGWQQDYTDFFDWNNAECANPTNTDPDYYFPYLRDVCTHINLSVITPSERWMDSPGYTSTRGIASYQTKPSDIGLHRVTITISDREGLEDFQDIWILVFDMPDAIINTTNDYDDIPPNRASFEDRYVLNASESTVGQVGGPGPSAYIRNVQWQDFYEPWTSITAITDYLDTEQTLREKTLIIPNELTTDTVDILNIKNYNFSSTYPPGDHTIRLTVTDSEGFISTKDYIVTVSECLPHNDLQGRPPYPFDMLPPFYASTLEQHLQADHTCCDPDYTYAEADTVCYHKSLYGEYSSLTTYYESLPDIDIINHYVDTRDEYGSPIYTVAGTDYENDGFQQEFTRYCSNDRGNVCTGIITETRTRTFPCQDNNGVADPQFNVEKCSGPGYSTLPSENIIDAQCVDYHYYQPGQRTFEQIFRGGTGICTNGRQPSDGTRFLAYDNTITQSYSCLGSCNNGQCNTPIDCICDSTIANNPAIAHPLCDNKTYAAGVWSPPSISTCEGGSPYFLDSCYECRLVDTPSNTICRSNMPMPLTVGCTAANPSCNGVQAGSMPTSIVCSSIDSTRRAMCSNTCQLVDSTDSTCYGPSTDISCTSDYRCEGPNRNSVVINSEYPYSNAGCNNECNFIPCSNGFRYDASNNACHSYPCTIGECDDTSACNLGNGNCEIV